ncbi:hypothetical protein JTB14_019605 [Gonioctena quinquepunctata]|nr:hypothetical protein JTB14_019605 [Gonioctena quinquepunctata]
MVRPALPPKLLIRYPHEAVLDKLGDIAISKEYEATFDKSSVGSVDLGLLDVLEISVFEMLERYASEEVTASMDSEYYDGLQIRQLVRRKCFDLQAQTRNYSIRGDGELLTLLPTQVSDLFDWSRDVEEVNSMSSESLDMAKRELTLCLGDFFSAIGLKRRTEARLENKRVKAPWTKESDESLSIEHQGRRNRRRRRKETFEEFTARVERDELSTDACLLPPFSSVVHVQIDAATRK